MSNFIKLCDALNNGYNVTKTIVSTSDVLVQGSNKGYVALAADTDGRVINVAVPTSNPIVAEHFKEIGHVLEDNGGGIDQLVKVILHFN